MTARLALVRGRVLPNGWVDLLRQCSLFGGAYLLYRLVEGIVGSNSSVAFAHARELISLERSMHIFVEPAIQGWATSSHLLVVIAAYVYINAQTTILIHDVSNPTVDQYLSYAGMVVPSNDFFMGNATPLRIFNSNGSLVGPITIEATAGNN